MVGFNFLTLGANVFLFHRSGVLSSRPFKLTTQEGFEDLVSHIAGILSIKDEVGYCLDLTRFQNMFALTTATMKLSVSFRYATACMVVPLLYYVYLPCKLCTTCIQFAR